MNILYYVCRTNVEYSAAIIGSTGDTYNVCYGHQHDGYTCECVGYQYRRQCKHITEVRQMRCGWNQYLHGRAPVIDSDGRLHCPWCNESIMGIRANTAYVDKSNFFITK